MNCLPTCDLSFSTVSTHTLQWLVSPEEVVLLMLKSDAGFVWPHRLHALAGTVGAATCCNTRTHT